MNSFEKTGRSHLRVLLMMGWLIIILNGAPVAMAQWVSHGPYGGTVTALAIDPKAPATLYAGTGTGVFKTTNGGANWNACNNGMTYYEIHALALDSKNPSTIYAGTQYGIYKSADGGNSWNSANNGLIMPTSVELIVIDPQTPSTIYITSAGLYKSVDGGQSWALLTIVAGAQSIVGSLVVDPQHPSTIYVGTQSGSINTLGSVYKSTDGGASWVPSKNGIMGIMSIGCMAIDPQVPTTIYAISDGFYKSTDGAANWKLMQNSPPERVYVLAIDPANPAIIYAGCYPKGVYKSSDGGESWSPADNGMANSFVRALAIDPNSPDIIFAGSDNDGVYKSNDSAESWTTTNSGLTISTVLALAIDPQIPGTLYAGTSVGVFKSSDGGGSWSAANTGFPGLSVRALAIDPQTPTTLYAGTVGGVFKSIDGGVSWTASGITPYLSVRVDALAVDPKIPTTMYLVGLIESAFGRWSALMKSIDGGGNWTDISSSLGPTPHTTVNVGAFAIDPQTPATLYAGIDFSPPIGPCSGVFQSIDGGGSWGAVSSSSLCSVSALAIDPQMTTTLYAVTDSKVFKSSDGGGSWSAANNGLPSNNIPALAIDPQTPATLYAGTDTSGVFQSSDGGGSWSAINSGLTDLNVHALVIDPQNPSRIYAGTGGGVFVASKTSCTYSITPSTSSSSSSGITSDQVTVTAAGCGWTAVSTDPWITITSGSSGSANGVVTFSVAPNTSPVSRAGTMTIAGETFTVTQAGVSAAFSFSSISPNSGPVSGGTSFTLHGGGFQVGASVSLNGVRATVSTVTSTEITATTGIATVPGSYDVAVTNPGGQSVVLSKEFTYTAVSGPQTEESFVPIVLSSGGMNGSFYTSEMTLTNRGNGNATVNFAYTATLGSGSGVGMDTLASGEQKIVPDAISYLRGVGVPIPSSGSQGGTLRASFSGLTSPADGSVTVRTTTVVPEGRVGLAYAGIPVSMTLTGPTYICGLRQNGTDRSNVAIQNVGTAEDGNIRLQLTVFSGTGGTQISRVLPEQVLVPGGFAQINGVLASNGLELSNGYVRVDRVSGTAPYYAYGVINDQVNSDGSFIPPVLESALAGKKRMTLPAVVETTAFGTELVATNWGSEKKSLKCHYVADAIQTADHAASFPIELNPHQQLILPDFVQWLRDSQVSGIGPRGSNFAGSLSVSVTTGDLSGVMMAARTSALEDEGRFGVFYMAYPEGENSSQEAWLYGLQQNGESRTNLALINTGETDSSVDTFRIELFNGDTGAKVATVDSITLVANRWYQIGVILSQYAPAVTQGYARITRMGGNNPFIAYAVTNDGAHPGDRSGDGAFIASAP